MIENDINNKDLQNGVSQRKQRMRSTAQLPAYRAAANILFLLSEVARDVPRKLLRLTDRVLLDAEELLKTIALANEFRGEERGYYLSLALANIQVVKTNVGIIKNMGFIRKERQTMLGTLLKSLAAQVAAWRDSVKSEGQ
jgi:hypothetical protein